MKELEILKEVYAELGGVSTKLAKERMQVQTAAPANQFELRDYKLTTQTMVLELKGVKFNDFAIKADQMGTIIQKLMRAKSPAVPQTLISLKAKKFDIVLNHAEGTVYVQKNYISTTHEMNSSIDFQYLALTAPKPSNRSKSSQKIYQLRLFRNGMLQIPGVTDMFDLSEARVIVEQLIHLYKELFEVVEDVSIVNKHVAMANFVTYMEIPPNSIIDIATASYDVKQDKARSFSQMCDQVGLNCIYFDLAVRRVVLYCKFAMPKERTAFSHYNPSSTSNRKDVRAITFQITQKGIVIIQGSDGNFLKTADIIERFQRLSLLFFTNYIKTPSI